MKNNYLAVILVLASNDKPLFKEFKKILYKYIDTDPDIRIHLVYGESGDPLTKDHADLIYPYTPENVYPGMLEKSIKAMSYCEEHYDYDFMVRTNLSTFWSLPLLKQRLKTYNEHDTWDGSPRKYDTTFVSGTDMVLSRNLVQEIIKHQNKILEWPIDEDRAISKFLHEYLNLPIPNKVQPHIILEQLRSFDLDHINQIITLARQKQVDHFRLKNTHDRYTIDLPIAKLLLKEYYDQTLL